MRHPVMMQALATARQQDVLHDAGRRHTSAPERPRRASPLWVRIRPISASDAPRLEREFALLSPQTRLARFLSPKNGLTAAELRYLTDVDHHDHEALVAVSRIRGRWLGIARYVRSSAEPATAELAVVVGDAWQERGVGTMLAARLAARARDEGVDALTALMARGNVRARRLLGGLGDVQAVGRDGATVTYRVTLRGHDQPRRTPVLARVGHRVRRMYETAQLGPAHNYVAR